LDTVSGSLNPNPITPCPQGWITKERTVDTMFADRPVADETANASATSRDPLPIVLKAALAHIERGERDLNAAEGHFTSAALRFKELKERVKAGEVGKVSWADYCAANIPSLTQRTVEGYIAMVTTDRDWNFEYERDNALFGATCRLRASMSKSEREAYDAANDAARAKRMGDGPYHLWREAHGKEDNAKTRAEWDNIGKPADPTAKSTFEDELYGEHKAKREKEARAADAKPTSSASGASKRNPEARKAQNAKAQANRRAKSSTIREANGGKASKPRQDRETAEQYQRLAMLAKVMDAGQLQIINELIEERWPGTEAKANAERDNKAA
jgi:hypothetical protein